MITMSMNSSEILRNMKADELRMRMSVVNRLRNLKIRPNKKGSQFCDAVSFRQKVEATKQEYIIVIYSIPNVSFLQWNILAVVKDSRNTFYVEMPIEGCNATFISHHVYRRYRERMKMPESTSIYRVISYFFINSLNASLIYDKNGKIAYSFSDGLLLGNYDESKGILYFRTFVSKDMLSGTQLEAFLLSEEYRDRHKSPASIFCREKDYLTYMKTICEDYKEVYEEAETIYNKFYEDNDCIQDE